MEAVVLDFPNSKRHINIADEILELAIKQLRIDTKEYERNFGLSLCETENISGIAREAAISMAASWILQASYRSVNYVAQKQYAACRVLELANTISQ